LYGSDLSPQRRTARERKDYLYRRAAILREAEISDKRRALRTALAAGRPALTGTLQDEALRADYKYDETVAQRSADDELALDDEYALSGVIDPRVLITTSRDPSSKLAGFAKELRLLIPTSIRMNRGNVTVVCSIPCATRLFELPLLLAQLACVIL
jgi:U3 small nucleolar ribonucleoprotein protein IMP4